MSSLHTQRNAVEHMLMTLRSIRPGTVARDRHCNHLLEEVVALWIRAAESKQKALQDRSVEIIRQPFNNPYVPGFALKEGHPLFVGRDDLLQRLEEELSRGDSRPALLLNGEKRIGKTSALHQLPGRLSTRFFPVLCDLQKPQVSSDVARFFEMIAAEIRTVVGARQIPVSNLPYKQLKEASERNEAAVYQQFNTWLKQVEELLEKAQRVLLLVFDEFEALGSGENVKRFDTGLLLRWFRSMIQNHPRVALLFSGTQSLDTMGRTPATNWAAAFVNVRMLRVSFLQPQDARKLITVSTKDVHSGGEFHGGEIFGDVVELIITQTGCHPFLIQAICSELLSAIRAQKRVSAGEQDVALAVEQVLERWEYYFSDLWKRTGEEQRACLQVLTGVKQADIHQIQEVSGLDEQATGRAMQALWRRDLVRRHEETYQIAAPIFQLWAERCITTSP